MNIKVKQTCGSLYTYIKRSTPRQCKIVEGRGDLDLRIRTQSRGFGYVVHDSQESSPSCRDLLKRKILNVHYLLDNTVCINIQVPLPRPLSKQQELSEPVSRTLKLHRLAVHYLLDITVLINIQVFPSLTLYQTNLYRCVFRSVSIVLVT